MRITSAGNFSKAGTMSVHKQGVQNQFLKTIHPRIGCLTIFASKQCSCNQRHFRIHESSLFLASAHFSPEQSRPVRQHTSQRSGCSISTSSGRLLYEIRLVPPGRTNKQTMLQKLQCIICQQRAASKALS